MYTWLVVGLVVITWLLLSRSRGTSVRVIAEDFEAQLTPTTQTGPVANACGEAERERFREGEEGVEVKRSSLDLPDGTPVEVLLNGDAVGAFELSRGHGEFEVESASGVTVPVVTVSDEVELRCEDLPILRGTFICD